MVTCVPGQSDYTASARTCAASWRISSRAGVVARYELERGVAVDRISEVGKLAIADHSHSALGKRRRNGFGDFEARNARLVGPFRAVGKSDMDHQGSLSSLADTNRRKRGSLHINVEPCHGNRRGAGDLPPSRRLERELLDHRRPG